MYIAMIYSIYIYISIDIYVCVYVCLCVFIKQICTMCLYMLSYTDVDCICIKYFNVLFTRYQYLHVNIKYLVYLCTNDRMIFKAKRWNICFFKILCLCYFFKIWTSCASWTQLTIHTESLPAFLIIVVILFFFVPLYKDSYWHVTQKKKSFFFIKSLHNIRYVFCPFADFC